VVCSRGGSPAAAAQTQTFPAVCPTSCPLVKRTVLLPQNFPGNDVNAFLKCEIENAKENGNLLMNDLAGTSTKRFVFGPTSFQTGMVDLQGCTAVFVISKQGMWEAHLWESPDMATEIVDADNNVIDTFVPTDDTTFNSQIINYIKNGGGRKNIFLPSFVIEFS
jgi:hypothetical protein